MRGVAARVEKHGTAGTNPYGRLGTAELRKAFFSWWKTMPSAQEVTWAKTHSIEDMETFWVSVGRGRGEASGVEGTDEPDTNRPVDTNVVYIVEGVETTTDGASRPSTADNNLDRNMVIANIISDPENISRPEVSVTEDSCQAEGCRNGVGHTISRNTAEVRSRRGRRGQE